MERDLEVSTSMSEDAIDSPRREPRDHVEPADHVDVAQPGHADTGTAAGVGGVTGAAVGAAAGPIGAAIGAVGGMVVGAAAERLMHARDDAREEHVREGEYEPRAVFSDPSVPVARPDAAPRHRSPQGGPAAEIVTDTTIDPERGLPLI